MKKILKIILSVALAFVCVFSFTACKKKVSDTTVDTSKVASTHGVSTNGGMTVVHDGYLYFINGTKTNDGTSLEDNTQSAICRVKYNGETHAIDDTTYEVVVDSLVGFNNGSIHIFGDYMYYATPCADVNNKATVLYNKTSFMRYDLVNKKSYEIYTTIENDAEETISYAYYIVGDSLYLVVYEKNNATITSLKIGKEITTTYVISDVTSCVLSENTGKCVTAGASKDANNYVFYTKAHEDVSIDPVQTGNKVYRTAPNGNTSIELYKGGKTISLLSIRNGKIVFASETKLYAQTIVGTDAESLNLADANVIDHNYSSDTSYLFIENKDGSISVLYYDSKAYNLNIITWKDGVLEPVTIQEFSKDDKFEFITTVTLQETEEPEAEGADPITHDVTYLIYINSKKLYKIEIAFDGNYSDSVFAEPILLTNTEANSASGLIIPEVIGDYIYIMASADSKTYLHRTNVTIDVNVSELEEDDDKKATFIGIKEVV